MQGALRKLVIAITAVDVISVQSIQKKILYYDWFQKAHYFYIESIILYFEGRIFYFDFLKSNLCFLYIVLLSSQVKVKMFLALRYQAPRILSVWG